MRQQGRRALVRAWLDGRSLGPQDPGQHLSPGWIDTPLIEGNRSIQEQGVEQFKAQVAAPVPMGRLGASEEVANAALFLASDDSSFITGVELFVDGGLAQI